jgi:hypothetical protein
VCLAIVWVEVQAVIVIVHADPDEVFKVILCQSGSVFRVARDRLHYHSRHFIGGLQTVSHGFGWPVGIPHVVGAIVVGVMHDQAGSLGQGDGLGVLVIPLPVKIPFLNPEQPLLFARREHGVTL